MMISSSRGFLGCCLALLCWISAGCQHPDRNFYPIGVYGARESEELAVLKAVGFNAVRGPARKEYLDAASRLGIRVLATPNTTAGDKFQSERARAAVEQFDSHPALWAWYVVDEPDLNLVSPERVRQANRFLKQSGATKPTALVLYQGSAALDYANITDILMVDRYPIPWLPLANFPQHLRQGRLALGPEKPLIAVIQAFDWSYYPDLLSVEGVEHRAPSYEELRCMTYLALTQRAAGIFYYCFADSRWDIREHPETWSALQLVVQELNERLPLFQGEHRWWPMRHDFEGEGGGFNAALESSISTSLVRVEKGNETVPSGDYIVSVNNTDQQQVYSMRLPGKASGVLPVFEEDRSLIVEKHWMRDKFAPYEVHIYGPLPLGEIEKPS